MVSDAVCEFEIATLDVAGNEERSPEEVTEPEDEEDAKEDPDKVEPDFPKSELKTTNDEATEPEAVVDAICELELAITEAVFNEEEDLKEPNDEDPKDPKEDEPAVVPCDPAVERVAAVLVEAGILPAETPPPEVWPDPEPLARLPVAAVVLEPEVPELLADLPDTAPRDDAVVATVGEDWLDTTVVKEKNLFCDTAVDTVV